MTMLLTQSFAKNVVERDIKTAISIPREGMVLVRAYENGDEVADLSAGVAGEDVMGFSANDNENHLDTTRIEKVVVPTVAPFDVQLDKTTPVTGQSFITGLTLVVGAPAAGQYSINTFGLVSFNVAEQGQTLNIQYKYLLTVSEAKDLFFQRHVNNTASADFNRVSVWSGKGEIFTDQFDAAGDFSSGDVFAGANGLAAATGNVKLGKVIHFPSIDIPFLGISFNI